MRLIDADVFAEYLGLEDTDEAREMNYGEIVTLEDFDTQPTVDAIEVVHGHWIIGESFMMGEFRKCSLCGTMIPVHHSWDMNYCPDCGAKMDGCDNND